MKNRLFYIDIRFHSLKSKIHTIINHLKLYKIGTTRAICTLHWGYNDELASTRS